MEWRCDWRFVGGLGSLVVLGGVGAASSGEVRSADLRVRWGRVFWAAEMMELVGGFIGV